MPHPVVHFEISGPDDRQLTEFYAGLFGWRMQPVAGADYTLVDTCSGTGINGSITKSPDGAPLITFYIETDDLQSALDKINLLGGKTETSITQLPGMLTIARFADLDGLQVGLVQAPADPADSDLAATGTRATGAPATGAAVSWFEVLGADADRSQRFYTEIFGWRASVVGPGYLMVHTGTPRGVRGGIGAAEQGSWATVYASVPDVAATLARAAELGGTHEYGPVAVHGYMQTGALRDPAGNVFGVYYYARH